MPNLRLVVLLMAATASFLAAQDPPGRVGRLSYRDGPVSFQPTGIDDWVDADINRPLTIGDSIWVGDRGRAEFHIGSTALRLSAQSALQFLNLDDQTVQIRLSEGSLNLRIRNLAPNQVFEVDTPNLAFNITQPGQYRIDANPDSQTTTVTVRNGEGEVTSGGQSFPLYTRQQAAVRGDEQTEYNLTTAGAGDEFDQWSSQRDARSDQSQSARYVSREVPGYEDLDQYGTWDNQSGYGQVWMPNSVSANWAPYHDGHWAWIDPWGWTWVDDAPWGFAPYHYGRWASFSGRWGWIPGPYNMAPVYAPALVGWVGGRSGGSGFSMSFSIGTAAAIGWFALGPREPYYPSYRSSQGYFSRVNRNNTGMDNSTLNNYYSRRDSDDRTRNYVNQRVRNGVIAVPENTFASGRRVNQYMRPVPESQMSQVRVVAAPSIAPQRSSLLGPQAGAGGRPAARPPAGVFNRRVVARTPPPAAAIPFERQQPALAKNPGRALPPTEVQRLRQSAPAARAPVNVVDMNRVRRVQPKIGAAPQPGQQQPQRQQQDVQQQQQQRQQQDTQKQQQRQQQDVQQQQLRRQQDAQTQQQQRQPQDTRQQQQLKQRQDAQQQQREQQDTQKQQVRQQQDAQQQQQRQQQDAQKQQQQKQQQDVQKQQQDAQRQDQQKRQQDAQQQQQRQQQDVQKQQQQKEQQDAQKLQQDTQRQDQQKRQQDAGRPAAATAKATAGRSEA
ncbi:MAG: branched-chain amino acid ABC transporter substrate-binding protein, partial [Bryobacterales bacterium]|nr:branched-chain amino acid ABC transporter substrate-binding protein [Bryobacterales bacterium]